MSAVVNPTNQKEFATTVVQRLRAAGHTALWAGGCVRDLLLGIEPLDYDVATSATPDQVRELFGYRHTLPVGAAFGVVIVLGKPRHAVQVEVATFRTDAAYSDGRHPDAVIFSTPQEDAQRRDFTINGMFYDPLTAAVIDYVGGQADLQHGCLRAIGFADDRIGEDKLRMLRAVRFSARFGFTIEAATRRAIARHAAEVNCVSGERIWTEIRKTLQTSRAAWAVEEWFQLNLLQHILPEVAAVWPAQRLAARRLLDSLDGVEPLPDAADIHSQVRAARGRSADWLDRLCGLLWIALEQAANGNADNLNVSVDSLVQSLKTRLKVPNEVGDTLRHVLPAQRELVGAQRRPWSQVQPWLVDACADRAVALYEARGSLVENAEQVAAWRETSEWLHQKLALPREQLDPAPLLLGHDLIGLGLTPSPRFGELLSQARQRQLDQLLPDRPAALRWLREQVGL